jgi:hypothetical protein
MASNGIAQTVQEMIVATAEAVHQTELELEKPIGGAVWRSYSIPRVSVKAKFGVTVKKGNTVMFFDQPTEQQLFNTLNFSLYLAPESQPGSLTFPAMPPVRLLLPPFIVPLEERPRLLNEVKDGLQKLDARRFEREIRKLDEAYSSHSDDPGLIFLRLGHDTRHLVVRLGGDRDGIFLLDTSSDLPLAVYSYIDMEGRVLPWQPFAELFATFRQWQHSNLTDDEHPDVALPDRLGAISVSDFTQGMWNGYTRTRTELSDSGDDAFAESSFYELRDVHAQLSYTVPRKAGGPEDQGTPFIRSQVLIGVDDRESLPQVRVQLVAPEFILVGEARSALLNLLQENLDLSRKNKDSLWSVLRPEYEGEYRKAFLDSQRQEQALMLLSYRDKPPQNEFLFVWSGQMAGEERDFAFRFHLKDKTLKQPELILPLEDPVDPKAPPSSPQRRWADAMVRYPKDHAGLHDFFHAIWVWDLAGGWFPRSTS